MEKLNNDTEAAPSFLRGFVEEAELLAKEVLSNPETKGYFELPPGMKDVREGNPSDQFRLKTHTMIFAAEQLLRKLEEDGKGTKEDFQNMKAAAKFVAFCKAQEPLSHLYSEAKDDPAWSELEEIYGKYMEEFIASALGK